MAEKPDHYYVKVRAKLLIDGEEVPLLSFNIEYALNRIPLAVFTVAQGRGMSGPGKGEVSSAHELLAKVKPFTPIEIKVDLEAPNGFSGSDDDDGLKDGETTVFKGFMMGTNQERKRAQMTTGLTFYAMGYPAALGGTTQFTVGLTQTNLGGSGKDHIVASLGLLKGLSNVEVLISSRDQDKKTVDKFILDLFDELAGALSTYNTQNESAKAALDRMSGNPLGTFDLPLNYGDVPARYADAALARFYGWVLWGSWLNPNGGADIWKVLQKFAQEFRFSTVSAIEKDAIAPVILGLGGEAWRTYEPSDYWDIALTPERFSPDFYSYIGAVSVTHQNIDHGLFQEKLPLARVIGFDQLTIKQELDNARFISDRLVTVAPPAYLICPPPGGVEGGLLGAFPSPDAVNPAVEAEDVGSGAIMDVWYGGELGNQVASYELFNRIFQHRNGSVRGRFRLDIAPGSLLKIVTIGDKFVGKSENLFAHAQKVQLICGRGMFATQVELTGIRTEFEHGEYTVSEHPMYSGAWRGAMLTGD